MIEIHITHTDHTWPWRYDLVSSTIDVTNDGSVPWFQYAPSAEECFRLAWAAKEEIEFRFWRDNQIEIQF